MVRLMVLTGRAARRRVRIEARGNAKRAHDERGVVLIFSALCLVAMVGMAALVVDVGNANQIRRHAQNGADAAALAGAQDLPSGATVVATVKAYAAANYDVDPTEWVGCTDDSALPIHPDAANANECISIDNAYTRVHVQLPNRAVETYFGPIFGRDAINTSAAATAEAVLTSNDRIIPATLTVTQGSGNLCIENSGNDSDCAARNDGNFGSLASPRLNFLMTQQHQDALRINWAMSIDHDIDIALGYPQVCDGEIKSPCILSNESSPETADHLRVETGNNVPDVTDGLISGFEVATDDEGSVSVCGRLARPDTTDENILDPMPGGSCSPGSPTITVVGTTINGRHVYYWLTDEAKETFYPEVYAVDTGDGPAIGDPLYDAGDARLECFLREYRYDQATGVETVPTCTGITDWDGLLRGTGDTSLWPIFVNGITADARFGAIPVVSYWPNGNNTAAPITGFWGLFIYRTYSSSTTLRGMDGWVYDPALIETTNGQPGIQFGFQGDPVLRLIE